METKTGRPWARGFFLAWVAVSAVWIAMVVAMAAWDYPTKASIAFQIEADDGTYVHIDRVLAAAEKAKVASDTQAEARLREIAEEKLSALRERQVSNLKAALLLGLIPSAVLLGFGLLAAWVLWPAAGFVDTKMRS